MEFINIFLRVLMAVLVAVILFFVIRIDSKVTKIHTFLYGADIQVIDQYE